MRRLTLVLLVSGALAAAQVRAAAQALAAKVPNLVGQWLLKLLSDDPNPQTGLLMIETQAGRRFSGQLCPGPTDPFVAECHSFEGQLGRGRRLRFGGGISGLPRFAGRVAKSGATMGGTVALFSVKEWFAEAYTN